MTYYLIESDSTQLCWVEAESELGAKRIHATRFGDDQVLDIIDERDDITYSVELEGREQPFRAIEELSDGNLKMYEKRANQAGSKGIYQLVYET